MFYMEKLLEITSVTNNQVKELMKLKQRKFREETGLFIMEGAHLVQEAYMNNALEKVFVRKAVMDQYPYPNRIIVSDEVMKKIGETVSLLDIVGVCRMPKEETSLSSKIVMLDGVQDPGNLGTIIRTCVSFGYNDLFVSSGTVDPYNEKVLRSTQGAIFKIHYHKTDLLKQISELKAKGYSVYGTALSNGKPLATFAKKEKIALIFGNEGNGASKEVLAATDKNIFIEMNDFESLNVAVAAGITMYYFK